jgi:hypothetical protein
MSRTWKGGGTLDTCVNCPKKYLAEVLEPIVQFKRYRIFKHTAIYEFYSLLRSAMMEAREFTC